MQNEFNFNVGDKVCIIQSNHVVPGIRGACGLVREVREGATFGNPPRGIRRRAYVVNFGPPLGEQLIPEGLLEHASKLERHRRVSL
jgi:hypothetical protein